MKLKLQVCMLCLFSVITVNSFAQNTQEEIKDLKERTEGLEKAVKKLNNLKVSGYFQGQIQSTQENGSLKVGAGQNEWEKAHNDSYNRIGIRRGRIKFTYEEGIGSAVFQLDITEKGVGIKDAYLNIKDPWFKTSAIRAGVFDRPFGYEISYSSSRRESPERSTVFQTLFPEERDLGAMLILQPAKTSPFYGLKFQGGLFAGNGIKQETDKRKDFIGQLRYDKKIGNATEFGLGVSTYLGGRLQGSEEVYTMDGNKFVLNDDASNEGKFAKRQYVGFDGEIAHTSVIGQTKLTVEALFGKQPGTAGSTKSFNSSKPEDASGVPTYIRNFNGGYVMFVQDLGRTPFSVVLKYDWYDPNTKVSKDEVGLNGTGKADLSQSTFGFGLLWNATKNIRLTAYYDINNYQNSENVPAMKDYKGDVFTLRAQYKF